MLALFALFFFAFRKPTVVPGKLQTMMEMGVDFVKEGIAIPMLGHDAARYVPLLTAFFFYILVGNLFEVFPFINFSANSRVAFPLVLAIISWIVYNARRRQEARVPRLPQAHVHHPRGARARSGTRC